MSEVRIREAATAGMITLKADLSDPTVAAALGGVPAIRRAGFRADRTVLWMAPDEVLKVMHRGDAAAAVDDLSRRLDGLSHLVADVSDARCHFVLSGRRCREVLAKVTPADMHPDAFRTGDVRRSRLAQVPAAFWMAEDGAIHVIAFRSVASYVRDLLAHAGRPEAAVDYF